MHARRALFFFTFLLGVAVCGYINEDELECEEAAVHLNDCCHPYVAEIDCRHFTSSFCGHTENEPLPKKQSRCLKEMTCPEIREGGLCDIELHGPRSYTNQDGDTRTEATTEVCP